jgi:hypothetical protein
VIEVDATFIALQLGGPYQGSRDRVFRRSSAKYRLERGEFARLPPLDQPADRACRIAHYWSLFIYTGSPHATSRFCRQLPPDLTWVTLEDRDGPQFHGSLTVS